MDLRVDISDYHCALWKGRHLHWVAILLYNKILGRSLTSALILWGWKLMAVHSVKALPTSLPWLLPGEEKKWLLFFPQKRPAPGRPRSEPFADTDFAMQVIKIQGIPRREGRFFLFPPSKQKIGLLKALPEVWRKPRACFAASQKPRVFPQLYVCVLGLNRDGDDRITFHLIQGHCKLKAHDHQVSNSICNLDPSFRYTSPRNRFW